MKSLINYFKMFVYLIILVFVDQLTKYWAVINLKDKKPLVIIKNVFELNYLDGGNTGAAWGIFSGKITMFIIFTTIVILAIIAFIIKLQFVNEKPRMLIPIQYILVALVGGAIGNLIDRVYNGYVVDFIYFKLINFPIFNIADCYVTISCGLLLIICFFFVKEDDFATMFSFRKKQR